ncbi:MAG: PaaI family thioesterase [Alphaproteobacteria bacterium]
MSGWGPEVETMRKVAAPAGYHNQPIFDPFEAEIGPFFRADGNDGAQKQGKPVLLALPIAEEFAGPDGNPAVGPILCFADASMGWAVWDLLDDPPCVTLSFTADWLQKPKIGDWVYGETEVSGREGDTVTARGTFRDQHGNTLLTTRSLWKLL